jgi:membrane protease YdiL (CAAX protease family)
VGLVLTSLVASAWLGATGDDTLDLVGRAVSQLAFWVGLVGAPLLASRRKGTGSLAADFGFRLERGDVARGVGAGILAQLVLVPIVALLLRPLLGDPDVEGPVQDLVERARGAAFVGLLAFVVLGAAVVEELFFRGLLLRALQRRMGTAPAVVVAAVLFGLSHLQDLTPEGLALVMVSLTALGGLFGWLAVRYGRLGPAIVAHATFNAWTLLILATR